MSLVRRLWGSVPDGPLKRQLGRTASGASGSVSQRGISRNIPGSAIGTQLSTLINPALP